MTLQLTPMKRGLFSLLFPGETSYLQQILTHVSEDLVEALVGEIGVTQP